MEYIRNLILQLSNYVDPLFKSFEGIEKVEITKFEDKLGFLLPSDFKSFLNISNGAVILYENIYGIYNNNKPFDLFENYLLEKNEVGNPIREYYLPIYPDGMGNHTCLDLGSLSPDGKRCNIIFWQHDRQYLKNEQPDIDAKSFTMFLEDLLNELNEYYNYDGTEKEN